MALRSPRSWNEAADLFGGGGSVDDLLDRIARTLAGGSSPFSIEGPGAQALAGLDRAAREMQRAQRESVQAQRQDIQGTRREGRQAGRVGGMAPGAGGPGGGANALRQRPGGGSVTGGGRRPGLPDHVTVPERIHRGNPNINRALDFDISQTNPHAAELARSVREKGGIAPMNVADSLVEAFRGSRQRQQQQRGFGDVLEGIRGERGTSPLGAEIAGRVGQAAGRDVPSPGLGGVPDFAAQMRGEAPDVDALVNTVRSSLGQPGGKSLAESLMGDIMQQVGSGRGLGMTPDADTLVARIRAQAQQQAADAARQGITPATGMMPTSTFNQTTRTMEPATINGVPQGGFQPSTIRPMPQQAIIPGGTNVLPGQPAGSTMNTTPVGTSTGYTNRTTFEQNLAGQPYQPGAQQNIAAPAAGTTGGGTLGSYGNQSIDQWDSAFIAAGSKYGVDPTLLKAMMEIESGGNGNLALDQCRDDGTGQVSCGPMQIKPGIWGSVGSVPEQVEQAAKILADGVNSGQYATHKDALFGIYFPGNDPNGTTQGSYGARVNELQSQMGAYTPGAAGGQPQGGWFPGSNVPIQGGGAVAPPQAAPGGQPPGGFFPGSNAPIQGGGPLASGTTPATGSGEGTWFPGSARPMAMPGDAVQDPGQQGPPPSQNVIVPPKTGAGTTAVDPAFDPNYTMNSKYAGPYNAEPRAVWTAENMNYLEALQPGAAQATFDNNYGYKSQGPDYYCDYAGWNCSMHSGVDVPTAPLSDLNALTGGQVICLGAQSSASNPGVGCGAYPDDIHGGIGNVSVLEPNGAVVVYGHVNSSYYGLDQQVTPGTPVAVSGGMASEHLHLDVKLPLGPNGEYILVDPNLYFGGHYCEVGFCPY